MQVAQLGSVVHGRPRQPAMSVGVKYWSMASCAGASRSMQNTLYIYIYIYISNILTYNFFKYILYWLMMIDDIGLFYSRIYETVNCEYCYTQHTVYCEH